MFEAVESASKADLVAVMMYTASLQVLTDFTDNRAQLRDIVNNLPIGEMAELEHALHSKVIHLHSKIRYRWEGIDETGKIGRGVERVDRDVGGGLLVGGGRLGRFLYLGQDVFVGHGGTSNNRT